MDTRIFSAYNEATKKLLSDGVRIVDAAREPLKVLKILMEGLSPTAPTGLWLTNFKGIPVARSNNPFDLVYIDQDSCIVHAVEISRESRFVPFKGMPESAMVLPPRSIASSKSFTGDRIQMKLVSGEVLFQAPAPRPPVVNAPARVVPVSTARSYNVPAEAPLRGGPTTAPASGPLMRSAHLPGAPPPSLRPPTLPENELPSSAPLPQEGNIILIRAPRDPEPPATPTEIHDSVLAEVPPSVISFPAAPTQEVAPVLEEHAPVEAAAPHEPAPVIAFPGESEPAPANAVNEVEELPAPVQFPKPVVFPKPVAEITAPTLPPELISDPGFISQPIEWSHQPATPIQFPEPATEPTPLLQPFEPVAQFEEENFSPHKIQEIQQPEYPSYEPIELEEQEPVFTQQATPEEPAGVLQLESSEWPVVYTKGEDITPPPEPSAEELKQKARAKSLEKRWDVRILYFIFPELHPHYLPANRGPRVEHWQSSESKATKQLSRTRRILCWLYPDLQLDTVEQRQFAVRRAPRLPIPGLVGYFYTGGISKPQEILNLSVMGFFMKTDERWLPGTVIRITLQMVNSDGEGPYDTITVHSRVVQWSKEGGGFEFVLPGFLD